MEPKRLRPPSGPPPAAAQPRHPRPPSAPPPVKFLKTQRDNYNPVVIELTAKTMGMGSRNVASSSTSVAQCDQSTTQKKTNHGARAKHWSTQTMSTTVPQCDSAPQCTQSTQTMVPSKEPPILRYPERQPYSFGPDGVCIPIMHVRPPTNNVSDIPPISGITHAVYRDHTICCKVCFYAGFAHGLHRHGKLFPPVESSASRVESIAPGA
jgi:hypothetical protein